MDHGMRPDAPPPERACRAKKRYAPESDAHRVAAKCFAERGEWLRVYACDECQGWHLTSMGAQPRPEWRPPERPARERPHRVVTETEENRDEQNWRRRRGSHGKARRYGKS